LRTVIAWANEEGRPWAFSLSNAGASYTEFRSNLDQLDELDWGAIASRDFRDPDVKERKQAEFLLHGTTPFGLVERIGVMSAEMRARVISALGVAGYTPRVEVRPDWYY